MNRPQHAAVFCVDEKTAIQALDRLDPVLPLSPGRAERHGFEYYRHGTLSLYAALDVKTGKVQGMTAARHTSQDFVAFLEGLVQRTPWARQIDVVLDNLSAHKTKDVEQFLQEHPRVRFHFTPTYSSWLNQVELWFAKIQRDVIARGVFTSVADLGNKLRRYIRHYSKTAKPFRWTYTDPERQSLLTKSPGQLTSVWFPFVHRGREVSGCVSTCLPLLLQHRHAQERARRSTMKSYEQIHLGHCRSHHQYGHRDTRSGQNEWRDGYLHHRTG